MSGTDPVRRNGRILHHDPVIAWACVNAVLQHLDQPDVLYGDFRDHKHEAADGAIDPVETARKILRTRWQEMHAR